MLWTTIVPGYLPVRCDLVPTCQAVLHRQPIRSPASVASVARLAPDRLLLGTGALVLVWNSLLVQDPLA